MKRREIIKVGAGALLSAGLWPKSGQAADTAASTTITTSETAPGESFIFLAINDLHFQEAACALWFAQVVEAMKKSAPEAAFCLLGGDLANEGKREQLLGVRTAFEKLGVPLYAAPGNHDHAEGDDRTAYDELWRGHLNQSFTHRGWQFVGLDTTDGVRYQKTKIQPATFDWLEANLPKLDKTMPTVLWTHFPLGVGVSMRPGNADALLEKLSVLNVRAVFCGHWHGFSEKSWRQATLTTNRCCARVRNNADGSPKKGWFVCTAKDGAITRRFEEIPLALRA